MAPDDDYWRRRQESDNYLSRVDDRKWFEAVQDKRRDDVFDGILEKNHGKAYDALGIPRFSDAGPLSTAEKRAAVPTIGEQFVEHSRKFINELTCSKTLPADAVQRWIGSVKQLDLEKSAKGLAAIDALIEDINAESAGWRPHRDIFNLGFDEMWRHDSEMRRIGQELNWLKAIFQRVDDYEKGRF